MATRGTPATLALARAGVAHRLHEYEPTCHGALGYGEEAARALSAWLQVELSPADLVRLTAAATAHMARAT